MTMKSLKVEEFAAMRYEGRHGTQIVALRGEVDLSSAHRLRELIWQATGRADVGPPRVVVDLSRVEFIDTAGLEVLLEEWNASRPLDGRMCLVAREGPVRRLLEVTGLGGELIDLYAELDAAVESCALAPA
jgi:anti-sigma B factor antagonist